MNFYEVLVFHFVIVVSVAAAPAVTGKAPFFDLHQQHFEREPLVGKDSREVNEFFKDVEKRPLLGTAPAGDDLAAFAFSLHEMFANDDRFDDEDVVLLEERRDFVANRRE